MRRNKNLNHFDRQSDINQKGGDGERSAVQSQLGAT